MLFYFKTEEIADSTQLDQFKEIAFEIAFLGQSGIDPKRQGYRLNKKNSGSKLIAFYYVGWAVTILELLEELQMPFDKEYEFARSVFNL